MSAIKELVDRFADELKKTDWDAYIQWVTLTYELSEENADPALFYIETNRIDMEFIKRKIMDATEAEEIELYPDHSMEVINPKSISEKLSIDVPVYHSEKAKELVIVPLVLKSYCINFTDYRDGMVDICRPNLLTMAMTVK